MTNSSFINKQNKHNLYTAIWKIPLNYTLETIGVILIDIFILLFAFNKIGAHRFGISFQFPIWISIIFLIPFTLVNILGFNYTWIWISEWKKLLTDWPDFKSNSFHTIKGSIQKKTSEEVPFGAGKIFMYKIKINNIYYWVDKTFYSSVTDGKIVEINYLKNSKIVVQYS